MEHHSAIDPADEKNENRKSRLAAENWDAPIVVTTNVQFFESLFAARTSRCRKLHNIAQSVVVLDEAQMLPPDFLAPILRAIWNLSAPPFGVSFVFCTATQPAFRRLVFGVGVSAGGGGIFEVSENDGDFGRRLRRRKNYFRGRNSIGFVRICRRIGARARIGIRWRPKSRRASGFCALSIAARIASNCIVGRWLKRATTKPCFAFRRCSARIIASAKLRR